MERIFFFKGLFLIKTKPKKTTKWQKQEVSVRNELSGVWHPYLSKLFFKPNISKKIYTTRKTLRN